VSTNGHEPAITDLGAILAETRPARVLRIPADAIREDSLTLYELVMIGRALGVSPETLSVSVQKRDGWAAVELAQAFAWIIARRVEPGLTWEEARTFGLDIVQTPADPTRPPSRRTRTRSGHGSS
jgi:hypothetical protein